MKIIIPMAGSGQRFKDKGYKDPKPLIKVLNKRIIEYVIDGFDKYNDEFIFICNHDHIEKTDMLSVLRNLVYKSQIISIRPHKLGPVYTVKQAFDYISDNEQIIISYCDAGLVWDYRKFLETIKITDVDGCLATHTGFHPHSLFSGLMAHCLIENNKVLQVKEKSSYTDNPMDEQASSGTYYFKKGSDLKKYCNMAIDEEISYNGEYYITLIYNLLIRDNLNICSYLIDKVISLGTPAEIESYISWKNIINTGQIKDKTDLRNCYYYWKDYLKTTDL